MELIDLTHTIEIPMPVYPGDEEPTVTQTAFLKQDGYNDFSLSSGMHVGTHIDAPLHFLAKGVKISETPVQNFFGRGRLIDAREQLTIHEGLLKGMDIKAHDIVLVLTGMDKQYRKHGYFENYPEVTEGFAQALIGKKVGMLGVDSCSPDKEPYEIHKMLLGENILIAENLTRLDKLVGKNFSVIALPIKIKAEAGLARIVAGVEDK